MEILHKDAFEEGEKQMQQIAEKFENFKKLCPPEYEPILKNGEFIIFAPYNITIGWQAKRFGERIGNCIKIDDLTEKELKDALQKLDSNLKEKEKRLGYEQKMKLLEVEEEIRKQKKAIDILIAIPDRKLQVDADIIRLNFLYKKKAIIENGYIRKTYDNNPIRQLETCIFPLNALEKYKKALDQKLFDRFELWLNDPFTDGVTLVGLIETNEYWLGYTIIEFFCECHSKDHEKKEGQIKITTVVTEKKNENLKVVANP